MRSLAVTCVLTVVLVLSLLAEPAIAKSQVNQWTEGSGVGAETSDIVSAVPDASNARKSASGISCSFQKSDADSLAVISRYTSGLNDPLLAESGGGTWFNKTCTDAAGNLVSVGPVFVANNPAPEQVAQQALDYRSLPAFNIALNPGANSPQIVNLPTWLSVGGGTWTPVTASASAGGVTATTTATPKRVLWNTGDGGSVLCNGPGVIYDINRPASSQHSDCTYAYGRSSKNAPGGKFTLTATVTWSVTWTATGVAAGQPTTGTLNDVSRSATTQVQVIEAGALNQAL